jgi:uncharacterized membrane protein YfcA
VGFSTALIGAHNANVLWTLLSFVLTGGMWWRLRRSAELRLFGTLALGSAAGLPLGLWVLRTSGETALARFVGLALLAFATYSLVNPRVRRMQLHWAWGLLAGAISGFFSGATSMGGPVAVVFLLVVGADKDGLRANLPAYFFLNLVLKLAMMAWVGGMLTGGLALSAAVLCAPLLAGMGLGMYAAGRASSTGVRRAVCVLLLVLGLWLAFGRELRWGP